MNYFQSLHSYEIFIYNLPNHFSSVLSSTLVIVRRSAKQGMIAGEILFADAYRLAVGELVDFADDKFVIQRYGYEAWQGKDKL